MKFLKLFLIGLVLFLFVFASKTFAQTSQGEEILQGVVTQVVKSEERSQLLEINITKGEKKNKLIYVENGALEIADYQPYKKNDKLLISYSKDLDGNDSYLISDYLRQDTLITLFVIFVVISILVTGIWGVFSILGMGFSFLVIFKMILPLIIKGYNPVLVTILGSTLIIPVNFYLSHGFNKKTHAAIIGTIISLIITGILSAVFINSAKLTGFSTEEAGFLFFDNKEINMVGIILAGIIIGTLGVLDDVTVSQSAIVFQLRKIDKNIKLSKLYLHAMQIGKDHITSMVNTLVLVYAGASMPLFLLFINNPRPFAEIINYELIAEEIIRTLIGSIGLITAIPMTTFIAALWISKNKTS